MAVLPNDAREHETSPSTAPVSPTTASIKALDDEAPEFSHGYLLGKHFPHPDQHGLVAITGFGRFQRHPVTF
jgi:hypothetical protein